MNYFGIEEKPYYNVHEAAALLQLGVCKTWGLLRDNKIKRLKIGRKTFILRSEIERIWKEGV